jgi:iron-sulfur cluster repair protein YtfE (RIC family)
MSLTQPLRDEHRALLPHIEKMRAIADSIDELPVKALRHAVDEAYEFLTHELIPHAHAEDRVLYRAVSKVLGAPQATATMWRDHLEIERFTQEIAALRQQITGKTIESSVVTSLRRVLYSLYAVTKLHLAKEEEIYLPLLEVGLTANEMQHLFEALEEAEHDSKVQPVR